MRKLGWLLALVVVWSVCNAQQDEVSAPVRVGRLTYFIGAVQVQRADNTGVDEPVTNMPVAEGTRLICGDYGQAEVEFEDGSLARVTPRSTIVLDTLGLEGGVAKTQMTVLSGLVYFELRKSAGYAYSVAAGGVSMSPVENSVVRISLGDGPAVFSVLSGSVRLERGFTAEVHAGESLHADANDDTRYFLNTQIEPESWDSWNGERDRAATDETEKRTAARDGFAGVQGYGWSDLDANGTWYDVPGQGQVWQPDAADEGFDPYGYGNWVWQGVGYVWASGYPWGWTPFRCGHWEFYPGFGWGWVPDGRCGRWGSGGGVVLIGSRRPPHYKVVLTPPVQPVKVHPILIVRGPDGLRPPLRVGGTQQVHGTTWTPLAHVGGAARTGPTLGLSRDYPVNLSTHLAVVGKVPKDEERVMTNPTNPTNTTGVGMGWRPVAARPGAAGEANHRPRPVTMNPAGPSTPQPPAAGPTHTYREPARTSVPVQAPQGRVEPAPAPVVQRPAPVAAPQPMYRAPAPAPAPPAPATPKVELKVPK